IERIVELDERRLAGVRPIFEPKTVLPLQSADFAVWEQRRVVQQRLENAYEEVRESLLMFLRKPHDWGLMQDFQIAEWADRIGVPKRSESWDRASWRPRFGSLEPAAQKS